MKIPLIIVIVLLICSCPNQGYGQSNFPFNKGGGGYTSFFISPSFQIYKMNGVSRTSARMDIGLGVSKLIIGGFFDGFIKDINTETWQIEDHMNSTGLFLGYVNDYFQSVHQISKVRFGPGNESNMFIVSPEFGFELNIFKYVKIGLLASYQHAYNIKNLPDFQRSNYSGFGGGINFRIGFFKNKK